MIPTFHHRDILPQRCLGAKKMRNQSANMDTAISSDLSDDRSSPLAVAETWSWAHGYLRFNIYRLMSSLGQWHVDGTSIGRWCDYNLIRSFNTLLRLFFDVEPVFEGPGHWKWLCRSLYNPWCSNLQSKYRRQLKGNDMLSEQFIISRHDFISP